MKRTASKETEAGVFKRKEATPLSRGKEMSTVCDRFRGAEKASSGEREMSYTRWMEKEGRLGVVHKKEGGGGG